MIYYNCKGKEKKPKRKEVKKMTVKELIEELNELVKSGEITEDARVRSAEDDDVFSVEESITGKDEVVIYF